MANPRTEKRVFEAAWEVITRRTFDRAMAATDLAERTLSTVGDFRSEEDELWVGDCALSKDREHLPRLARATGLGFAVYAGNWRIAATTVLDAGCAPNVGEFAAAPLADTVLRRGEVFRGNVEYAGRRYIAVGRPIFTKDGANFSPIGMLEAFQDEEAFLDLLAASARNSFERQSTDYEKRADSVESVIQFVDTVARRLQLLALNGNIIAAQAGKQGSAFRVVCSQLGILADQAKTTTAHVRKLLPKKPLVDEMEITDDDEDNDDEILDPRLAEQALAAEETDAAERSSNGPLENTLSDHRRLGRRRPGSAA